MKSALKHTVADQAVGVAPVLADSRNSEAVLSKTADERTWSPCVADERPSGGLRSCCGKIRYQIRSPVSARVVVRMESPDDHARLGLYTECLRETVS